MASATGAWKAPASRPPPATAWVVVNGGPTGAPATPGNHGDGDLAGPAHEPGGLGGAGGEGGDAAGLAAIVGVDLAAAPVADGGEGYGQLHRPGGTDAHGHLGEGRGDNAGLGRAAAR